MQICVDATVHYAPIYSDFNQDWLAKARCRLIKEFSSIQLTRSKHLLKEAPLYVSNIHNVWIKSYSNYCHADVWCYTEENIVNMLDLSFQISVSDQCHMSQANQI